MLVGSGAHKE